MRIVIATSGSGGHLSCGLSIAEMLRERVPGIKIFFLGSYRGFPVSPVGERFYRIYATGFRLSQVVSVIQSGLLYLYIRPHIVISTGGFASIGIVFWSWFFNTPCIIHEQNLVPGKANRLSSYLADKILVAFEETKDYFKKRPFPLPCGERARVRGRGNGEGAKRCIFTGVPVRFKKKIPIQEARQKLGLEPGKFTILVMGGSRGARKINQILVDILEKLPHDLQFIHLTGAQDMDFVKEAYKKSGFSAYVEGFSTRMDIIYSASNLVIGRAGSGMLSEITFFGLPSILIPYPYSKDRHQYKNAGYLEQKGAAVVISEESLSSDRLCELINSRDRFQEMARCSAELSMPYAADRIVDEIMELVHE